MTSNSNMDYLSFVVRRQLAARNTKWQVNYIFPDKSKLLHFHFKQDHQLFNRPLL